ncbi:hypothetical protein PHSY_000252 [Pseudozyma hubeiensis SY62]|uniref:Uncharacterized protein n=1 Tax=Pseudozyma hubeiensis (strain SY62) TaxID=1305764 RepID=R9NW67_PSEHS|nr:hypothetical protein PHSY_000252 [Pseudozyma hubeiensis SY62]GAC92697.1 hypothetical protein PHSY_000252 [Pseudozyma hubeiensis SY62]
MGGNDTYAGAIHDDETGTYSNVASARGDTNEWARLAFETMGGANGAYDSICMGMTDRDHHEKVAVIRFQISTNQEYEGLDTDACNGYGWRKRSPLPSLRPESDGIICQKEYGPSTVCCNAGGGCRVVNGECAANLDQPETACDGIWCEPQRVCA